MRRFYALLLGLLLLSLSASAQTPKSSPGVQPTQSGETYNDELVADFTLITTVPSGPVGVIVPRPLLPLPIPQPTATPLNVAGDSALSLPAT